MSCVDCSAKNPLAVKSSLINPDGGLLVDLVVSESQMDLKTLEAESMSKLKITKVDLEWVHVLSEGWASPLKGFMREDEYLQSLHFNCLRMKDGSIVNMSLPIVLAIDDQAKERIGASIHVALVGPDGDLVGVLRSWQKISDPGSIAEVLKQVYADHSTEVDKVFSRILETAQHPAAAASFVSIMFAPRGQLSFWEALSRCQVNDVPICLMYGKEDPWVKPVWGLQVKRRRPEAPYYEISPAGHCPHDEVPEILWCEHYFFGRDVESFILIVHHSLSAIAVAYAMFTGEGQLYTFMVLISEITTPEINMRWYLDTAGLKRSSAYLINGVVIFFAWLVARILLFAYMFCHVYLHYDQVIKMHIIGFLLVFVVPSALATMNLIWFGKIIKGLKKTFAKRQ